MGGCRVECAKYCLHRVLRHTTHTAPLRSASTHPSDTAPPSAAAPLYPYPPARALRTRPRPPTLLFSPPCVCFLCLWLLQVNASMTEFDQSPFMSRDNNGTATYNESMSHTTGLAPYVDQQTPTQPVFSLPDVLTEDPVVDAPFWPPLESGFVSATSAILMLTLLCCALLFFFPSV